jgi:hypothetical protein
MASHRTRWNNEEKALLIGKANELIKRGVTRPLDALRRAQSVLPRNRRRALVHMGQVPWFKLPAGKPATRERASSKRSPSAPLNGNGLSKLKHPVAGREVLLQAVLDFFREVIERVYADAKPSTSAPSGKRGRRGGYRQQRSRSAH